MISLLVQVVNLMNASIVLKVLTELFGCLYQVCGLSVLLFDAETSQLLDPGYYRRVSVYSTSYVA
jgi:hypothetical protein